MKDKRKSDHRILKKTARTQRHKIHIENVHDLGLSNEYKEDIFRHISRMIPERI